MNWISQSNFAKWVIIILFIINIATVAIMWIYIADNKKPPRFEEGNRPPEPVGLMQKELGLTDEQTKQIEEMRAKNFEKTKNIIDEIIDLKGKLSDQLFADEPDTTLINATMKKIGMLQAEMETQKFNDFRAFISICTKEQREKLKPILEKVLIGVPPMVGRHGVPNGFGMEDRNMDSRRPPMRPGENKPQFPNRPNDRR